MAKTTLKSLARELNLSVSTVSKALNDSYEISEVTKEKVKALAEKLNYKPNVLAQFLKTGRTRTVGVVIPKMTNPFESQIIEGIQQAAIEKNYRTVVISSLEDEKIERLALESMVDKSVDAILFCPLNESSNTDLISEIIKYTPLVIFDRTNYPIDTHKIGVLNAEGTYNACMHLFDNGRDKIAIFCGLDLGLTPDRISGYTKAHEDKAIPLNNEYYAYCSLKSIEELHRELEENVKRLLALPTPPNAILAISDTITTHLLGVLAHMEIAVPAEIAVIGFANTELALSLNPSLSTIRQPARDIGQISFKKAYEIINTKYKNQIEWQDIKLPTTIQLRKSTKG